MKHDRAGRVRRAARLFAPHVARDAARSSAPRVSRDGARLFAPRLALVFARARGVSVFAAAENLTGRRYEVGRTPVLTLGRTLGPPFFFRVGLRLRVGE